MERQERSRFVQQSEMLSALRTQAVIDTSGISFAGPAESDKILNTCLEIVKCKGVQSRSILISQWSSLQLLVNDFVDARSIDALRIVHRYAAETGAIVVRDRSVLCDLVGRWDIGSSDLCITDVACSNGIWISRDFYDASGSYVRSGVINIVQW